MSNLSVCGWLKLKASFYGLDTAIGTTTEFAIRNGGLSRMWTANTHSRTFTCKSWSNLQILIDETELRCWLKTTHTRRYTQFSNINKKQLFLIPFFSSTSSNQYPYITESHQSWWKPQNRTTKKTTHPHKLYQQVMLLGDSGVGKTCLLVRFRDGTFLSGNFISTVGIDFRVSDNASKIEWNARLCLCYV